MKKGTVTQREADQSPKTAEMGTEASDPSPQKATDCLGTSVGHVTTGKGHDADSAAEKSCAGAPSVTNIMYYLQEMWKTILF